MAAKRCSKCSKKLYTFREVDGIINSIWQSNSKAPFGATPDDYRVMDREWGWQSSWVPSLCRGCDREHDHWKRPPVWVYLRRWIGRFS